MKHQRPQLRLEDGDAYGQALCLGRDDGSAATPDVRGMATGRITYIENGKEWRWDIGCMAWETPEHMKKHLAIWRPKAQFVSAEIIPDKPPVSRSRQRYRPLSPK